MSLFRRLFDTAFRRAKRAEGAGEYRKAASGYAEADMPAEAARVLLVLAARSLATDERVRALRDALHHLEADDPSCGEVRAQIGKALLEQCQADGVRTLEDRRRAQEAGELLEGEERFGLAASAYELLGRPEDVARCLEAGGEVERLEALLDSRNEKADEERSVQRLVREYEMALATGARLEARASLRAALDFSPGDISLREMLTRLDGRMPQKGSLRLVAEDTTYLFVGSPSVAMGREGALSLRGASLSRRHAEVRLESEEIVVEDMGSRNGTLVGGIPIGGKLRASGSVSVGLGEDVTIVVSKRGALLDMEVSEGLDRGLRVIAGTGTLTHPSLPLSVTFSAGVAILTSTGVSTQLMGADLAAPIVCLVDDVIEIDGVRVEVR